MPPVKDKERVYFILINQIDDFGFADYRDKDGNYCVIEDREDPKTGKKKKRYFHWTTARRSIGLPAWQEEEIEFLRKSPFTEGSPNCPPGGARIKEMNEDRDAQVLIDDTTKMTDAMNAALKLEGEKLRQIAYMYGITKDPEGRTAKAMVIKNATVNPEYFLSLFDSPNLEVKALVEACIAEKVFTKQGEQIYFEKDWIGNFDQAVSTVTDNKELQTILKKKLEAQGKKS